jgi:hypothetical protein
VATVADPNRNQARAFDLPGWPCPPRVRDIPNHEESWGWITVSNLPIQPYAVAQDELGYLWVNGNTIPTFKTPNETDVSPGALVFWTETGIGLWVHPKSLRYLPSISQLDMKPDEWLPVRVAAKEWPPFIKVSGGSHERP